MRFKPTGLAASTAPAAVALEYRQPDGFPSTAVKRQVVPQPGMAPAQATTSRNDVGYQRDSFLLISGSLVRAQQADPNSFRYR